MKQILNSTIYLLSYLLMWVSFLSIIIPYFGFKFYYVVWGNFGGFSLVTDIAFIRLFYYGNYCWLTRYLPFSLILINLINILGTYFTEYYSQWYEVVIFSVILFIGIYVELNKRFNKW